MMPVSKNLAGDWMRFLGEIDRVRTQLRCSNSLAWFRGHADSNWKLAPSLFRYGTSEDPDDNSEIRRHERDIDRVKKEWNERLDRKTALKKEIQQSKERNQSVEEMYHATCSAAKEKRAELAERRRELLRFRAPINGERELYDEFIFRAGKSSASNSWEVLAEMRHFGVPTRLLDWTDRLDIAFYFALEKYQALSESELSFPKAEEALKRLPEPCIWVLNPYHLSRRVAGRTAIWNLALDSGNDYYGLLLRGRKWPYDEPIPTYPPAPLERVRAQRGYFTVFGNNKQDMEAQLSEGLACVGRVPIPWQAAIFCLDYLSRIQGLSQFEVYRDLDSLGRELVGRFARIHKR